MNLNGTLIINLEIVNTLFRKTVYDDGHYFPMKSCKHMFTCDPKGNKPEKIIFNLHWKETNNIKSLDETNICWNREINHALIETIKSKSLQTFPKIGLILYLSGINGIMNSFSFF